MTDTKRVECGRCNGKGTVYEPSASTGIFGGFVPGMYDSDNVKCTRCWGEGTVEEEVRS